MNVLIDADVVLDVYLKRQPHYAASNGVLCLARRKAIAATVASHTLSNLFYLCGREILPFFRDRLLEDLEVSAADAYGVKNSLSWGFPDLEDALQAAAALAWKSSFIVTRNVRDYKRAPIPALSPADFLRRFFSA